MHLLYVTLGDAPKVMLPHRIGEQCYIRFPKACLLCLLFSIPLRVISSSILRAASLASEMVWQRAPRLSLSRPILQGNLSLQLHRIWPIHGGATCCRHPAGARGAATSNHTRCRHGAIGGQRRHATGTAQGWCLLYSRKRMLILRYLSKINYRETRSYRISAVAT